MSSVKVMLLPSVGVRVDAVLVIDRSAEGVGTGVSVSVLSLGSGSGVVVVTVAVFAYGPAAFTVTTIESVAPAPLTMLPTVHTPVPLVYVPWLGVAETKV